MAKISSNGHFYNRSIQNFHFEFLPPPPLLGEVNTELFREKENLLAHGAIQSTGPAVHGEDIVQWSIL